MLPSSDSQSGSATTKSESSSQGRERAAFDQRAVGHSLVGHSLPQAQALQKPRPQHITSASSEAQHSPSQGIRWREQKSLGQQRNASGSWAEADHHFSNATEARHDTRYANVQHQQLSHHWRQETTEGSQAAYPWPITHDSPFLRQQAEGAFPQLSLADHPHSQALPLPAVSHHARSDSIASTASEVSAISMFELPTDHYHSSAFQPSSPSSIYGSRNQHQIYGDDAAFRQMPRFQTTLVSPVGASSSPLQNRDRIPVQPHNRLRDMKSQTWPTHTQDPMSLNEQRLAAMSVADWGLLSNGVQESGKSMGGPSMNNRKLGLYKTELCRSWESTGNCRYGHKCQFAHSRDELRVIDRHPKHKSEVCKTFWMSGQCPYGRRCCFIHTNVPGASHTLSSAPAYDTTLHPEPQAYGTTSRLQQRRSDVPRFSHNCRQPQSENAPLKLDLQYQARPQYHQQHSGTSLPGTESTDSTRTRSPSSSSTWSSQYQSQSPDSSAGSASSRENDPSCSAAYPFSAPPSRSSISQASDKAPWQPFSAEILDTSGDTAIGSQARFLTELLDE